jgi:DNA-binding beta-propeller fold protein YncE
MRNSILLATGLLMGLMFLTVPIQAEDPVAYVINATGETLSRINLATGDVDNDLVTLGSDIYSYPSQIIVFDSIAYVLNSGTDEIQLIDLKAETTIGYVSTGIGSNPYWMEFYDRRYLYVTLWSDEALIKLDMESGLIDGSWPIGPSPEGVLIHDHKVYIAVTGFNQSNWTFGQGRVAVLDTRTDQFVADIPVGKNPQYLARDGEGRIHVVCTGDYVSATGIAYVIDPAIDAVLDSLPIGGTPGAVTIGPDNLAYVAGGGWVNDGLVFSYDALALDLLHGVSNPLVVDSGCMMVVASKDSACFVGSFKDFVKPIDSSGSELAAYAVGDGPIHLDFRYVPGDFNHDSRGPDITDLIVLVDYMFQGGEEPWPIWTTNVNGDLSVADITDLIYLVSYMFQEGPSLKFGPKWVTP